MKRVYTLASFALLQLIFSNANFAHAAVPSSGLCRTAVAGVDARLDQLNTALARAHQSGLTIAIEMPFGAVEGKVFSIDSQKQTAMISEMGVFGLGTLTKINTDYGHVLATYSSAEDAQRIDAAYATLPEQKKSVFRVVQNAFKDQTRIALQEEIVDYGGSISFRTFIGRIRGIGIGYNTRRIVGGPHEGETLHEVLGFNIEVESIMENAKKSEPRTESGSRVNVLYGVAYPKVMSVILVGDHHDITSATVIP